MRIKLNSIALILLLIGLSACNLTETPTPPPDPTRTPKPKATDTMLPSPTPTLMPSATPALFPTATIKIEGEEILPFSWPVPVPTKKQIIEARKCNLSQDTVNDKYPKSISLKELLHTYHPNTACDWALLALAFGQRVGEGGTFPPEAIYAFGQAVRQNPALALKYEMFYTYFSAGEFVLPPPQTQIGIAYVFVEYSWGGMGSPVDFTLEIDASDSDSDAVYSGTVTTGPDYWEEGETTEEETKDISGTINQSYVQGLASGFSDLIPIQRAVNLFACFDNYPNWIVIITFSDDSSIALFTNGSNFLYAGGPWQTEIDGQLYIQYSFAFIAGLWEIIEVLELPLGETMAMACFPFEGLFNEAFPP